MRSPWLAGVPFAALLLAGCVAGSPTDSPVADVSIKSSSPIHGGVLPHPYVVPDVTLTDTGGQPYDIAHALSAPITLIFFGYTNCPDTCPLVMSDIASARLRLPEAERQKVAVLFITSDPARDTPAVLRRWLDRYTPDAEGLTGPLAKIVTVAKALGVPIEQGEKLSSGGYTVNHGSQIVGVLPDGKAPFVWGASASSAELADDLAKILANKVPLTEEQN